MTQRHSITRNTLRALFGTPLLGAQHLWRQRYVHRSSSTTTALSVEPPATVARTAGSSVQTREDGTGPLVMRSYVSHMAHASMTAEALITQLRSEPNSFSPQHVAGFHTPQGERAREMSLGGEYVVEIPGPWNGPVRVDEVTDNSFTLITLDGHMEAGHIRFTATDGEHALVETFEIRSWARAGDPLFERLHVDVKLGHEAQTAMWIHTCDRAIAISGGTRCGPIAVGTETLAGSERRDDV